MFAPPLSPSCFLFDALDLQILLVVRSSKSSAPRAVPRSFFLSLFSSSEAVSLQLSGAPPSMLKALPPPEEEEGDDLGAAVVDDGKGFPEDEGGDEGAAADFSDLITATKA
jgi:hypothetical protein